MKILAIYLVVINLAGVYVMWADKRKAKKEQWRIPEKTLFLVALLGGCLGTTLGMYLFRHKTKHWYFKYGMPAILVIEAALLVYFVIL
ncbi:MAG: DUF1294 domain-containing protein [Lachnospiraceae bacterium]|nr:DUF1294 domain-containing protein [Lachnospiraceae bacterium]